jgi:hypothetical protein
LHFFDTFRIRFFGHSTLTRTNAATDVSAAGVNMGYSVIHPIFTSIVRQLLESACASGAVLTRRILGMVARRRSSHGWVLDAVSAAALRAK